MSGSSTPGAASTDSSQRWADLDKQNERLVDATHPLLADLRRDYPVTPQPAAASLG